MERSSQTLEGRKDTKSPKLIILAPEILFLVASFASKSTLTALARTSKMMLEESRKLLYRDIVIEDELSYVPFFAAFTYPPFRGPFTDKHDSPDPDELILPGEEDRDRLTRRLMDFVSDPVRPPSVTDYFGTITLLVPPPLGFESLLQDVHPHLSRQPCQPSRRYYSSYLPISLSNLTIHSRQRDYETFSFICELLSPTNFQVVSLDRRARTWHTDLVVICSSWLLIETIVMKNCMIVRPEQGAMSSTIAIPYQECDTLRRIRIEITKEDQPEPDDSEEEENERTGVLDSIWYHVPPTGSDEEFGKLAAFEVAVTGKERLDGLKRWTVEGKHVLTDQRRAPKRWESWFRLELLEGEVEVLPWREGDSEKDAGESESEEESEEEQSEVQEEEEQDGDDGNGGETSSKE